MPVFPIFVHIPKTAGTTIHTLLRKIYKNNTIFVASGTLKFVRDALYKVKSSDIYSYKCLHGHFTNLVALNRPDLYYFTFFRNPIKQFLSEFRYIKFINRNNRFHYLLNSSVNTPTEYLRFLIEIGADNPQTRYISEYITHFDEHGNAYEVISGNKPMNMITHGEFLYNEALIKLKKYNAVFLTDRFDEALVQLSKDLNWEGVPFYIKTNKSNMYKLNFECYEVFLEEFEKAYALDIKLYNLVKNRYSQQVNKLDYDLDEEVSRYQNKRKLVSPILKASSKFSYYKGKFIDKK
jgi:hypothetical protein